MACGAVALALIGVVVAGIATYIVRGHDLAKIADDLAESQASQRLLVGALGEYRNQFGAVGRGMDDGSAELAALIERSRTLRTTLASAKTTVGDADGESAKLIAIHESATRQLDALESTIRTLGNRGSHLRTEIAALESRLGADLVETPEGGPRDSVLVARVKTLERRIASLQASETDLVKKLSESTAANIGDAERTIRLAGLDADRLLDSVKIRRGFGGPFVAFRPELARPHGEGTVRLHLDQNLGRWNELRAVLRTLPLSAPLSSYELASGFGQRQDPFNGRAAMHNGLDLTGPLGSPIYATAPGVVSFAGWRDRYGKMVEIDHGLGVRTRYGHLRQLSVGPGQMVDAGEPVGEMGSTGRSTGPHLHYEVLLNEEPQDPMKFIEAGVRVHKN
jgi:murein DD-endopeptidase MepM/ murein hydrolase activator NlpD